MGQEGMFESEPFVSPERQDEYNEAAQLAKSQDQAATAFYESAEKELEQADMYSDVIKKGTAASAVGLAATAIPVIGPLVGAPIAAVGFGSVGYGGIKMAEHDAKAEELNLNAQNAEEARNEAWNITRAITEEGMARDEDPIETARRYAESQGVDIKRPEDVE